MNCENKFSKNDNRTFISKLLFEIIALICLISLIITSLHSCEKERSAEEIMLEFKASYGIGCAMYSSDEGGEGIYDGGEIFLAMLGGGAECVGSYLMLLVSGLEYSGECAVFVCFSRYDAMLISERGSARIGMLRSSSAVGVPTFASDGFVMRRGKVVIMCALSDNERAKRIFERIL